LIKRLDRAAAWRCSSIIDQTNQPPTAKIFVNEFKPDKFRKTNATEHEQIFTLYEYQHQFNFKHITIHLSLEQMKSDLR
jgi:hypothetical protein